MLKANQCNNYLTIAENVYPIIRFYSLNQRLNSNYRYYIKLIIPLNNTELINKRRATMCLTGLNTNNQQDTCFIHGFITQYTNDRSYILESPLSILNQQQHQQIYFYKTLKDMIQMLFNKNPLNNMLLEIDIETKTKVIPMINQYQQSDYELLQELCQQYALTYIFLQQKNSIVFFITDQLQKHLQHNERTHELIFQQSVKHKQSSLSIRNIRSSTTAKDILLKSISSNIDIQPGDRIRLSEHPINKLNKDYYVIQCQQNYDQSAGNYMATSLSGYRNKLMLIPVTTPYVKYLETQIRETLQPSQNVATILANDTNKPQLDQQGYYQAQWRYDARNNHHSIFIPRLQHHIGLSSGWHFPLYHKTQVIADYINHDKNNPLLLGSLHQQHNPVTQRNQLQAIIRSYAGNSIVFDDTQSNPHVLIHTHAEQQSLRLNANGADGVSLSTQHGDISHVADKAITLNINNNLQQQIQQNHNIVINGQYQLQTQQGNIELHSGKDLLQHAIGDFEQFAAKNMRYLADDHITLQAEQHVTLRCQQQYQLTANNEISIHSGKGILINNNNNGQLSLQNKHCRIQLMPDGRLVLHAKKIKICCSHLKTHSPQTTINN